MEAVFSRGLDVIHEPPAPDTPHLTRVDYLNRAARGGYPDAVRRELPVGVGNCSRTRATGAPKITFVDSGLAAHLVGGLATGPLAGNLVENFAIGELGRQLTWCEPTVQLFHYRDRDQREVDAVLEDLSGRVMASRSKRR